MSTWDEHEIHSAKSVAVHHKPLTINAIPLTYGGYQIAEPNGDIYFNSTGNPGLSKGGSGVCLAGMIASFAAQGYIEIACAVCGVYLHGLAADRAAKELSEYGMLPTDIPNYLCRIFAEKGL